MADHDTSQAEPKKKRRRLGCGVVLLLLIAALTLTGVIMYYLYHSDPAGWTNAQVYFSNTTPMQREAVASALEKRLFTEASFSDHFDEYGRPLPDRLPTRTVRLSTDQINAWLDQRLNMWLSNQRISWPKQLSRPAFWTDEGGVVLGVRLVDGEFDRVVSLAFAFDFPQDEQAEASVQIAGVWVGRLRVPLGKVVQTIREQWIARGREEEAAQLETLVTGLHFPPIQEINHQPYARWLDIRAVDGGLEIELKRE